MMQELISKYHENKLIDNNFISSFNELKEEDKVNLFVSACINSFYDLIDYILEQNINFKKDNDLILSYLFENKKYNVVLFLFKKEDTPFNPYYANQELFIKSLNKNNLLTDYFIENHKNLKKANIQKALLHFSQKGNLSGLKKFKKANLFVFDRVIFSLIIEYLLPNKNIKIFDFIINNCQLNQEYIDSIFIISMRKNNTIFADKLFELDVFNAITYKEQVFIELANAEYNLSQLYIISLFIKNKNFSKHINSKTLIKINDIEIINAVNTTLIKEKIVNF
jgi:hypothetical protein